MAACLTSPGENGKQRWRPLVRVSTRRVLQKPIKAVISTRAEIDGFSTSMPSAWTA